MKRKKEIIGISTIFILIISIIIVVSMILVKLLGDYSLHSFKNIFGGIENAEEEYIEDSEEEVIFKYEDVKYYPYEDKDGKWGYVDEDLNIVIPAKYLNAYSFSEGLGLVEVEEGYNFVDKNDNFILNNTYDYAESYKNGVALVNDYLDNDMKIIDFDGNEVGKVDEELGVYEFNEGRAIFSKKNKYGYINKQGKTVIKAKYEYCEDYNNGIAIVSENGKYSLINTSGKKIIDKEYDYIDSYENRYFLCGDLGNTYVIDSSGREVTLPRDIRVLEISEGGIIFTKNNKYGLLDYDGNIIIEPKFEYLSGFYNGLASARVYNEMSKEEILVSVNMEGKILGAYSKDVGSYIYRFYGDICVLSARNGEYLVDKFGNLIEDIGDASTQFVGDFLIINSSEGIEEKTKVYNLDGKLIYEDSILYIPESRNFTDNTKILVLSSSSEKSITLNSLGKILK